MRKERSLIRCLKIAGCVVFSVFILILLLLYHRNGNYEEKEVKWLMHSPTNIGHGRLALQPKSTNEFELRKSHDHYVTDFDNNTRQFSYVVFSDPQIGLYDMMTGNGGNNYAYDINKLRQLATDVISLKPKPDFIFCAGDLNNAFPLEEPSFQAPGFQPVLRPQQTSDLMGALKKYFNIGIPLLTIPGNHDLSENTRKEHVKLYTDTWGDPYYYFWNAGRVFIALETQIFRSEEPETVALRNEESNWLEKLFHSLPKGVPKTIFQHVPLFLKDAGEQDSGDVVPNIHRKKLLRLFCENNVDIILSGHTHLAYLPKPHRCGNGNSVRQIVLTSISAQFRRDAKPSYIVVNVDALGKTSFKILELL